MKAPTIALASIRRRLVAADECQFRKIVARYRHGPTADIGQGPLASRSLMLVGEDREHLLVFGWAAARVGSPDDDVRLAIVGRNQQLVGIAELFQKRLELFGVFRSVSEPRMSFAVGQRD